MLIVGQLYFAHSTSNQTVFVLTTAFTVLKYFFNQDPSNVFNPCAIPTEGFAQLWALPHGGVGPAIYGANMEALKGNMIDKGLVGVHSWRGDWECGVKSAFPHRHRILRPRVHVDHCRKTYKCDHGHCTTWGKKCPPWNSTTSCWTWGRTHRPFICHVPFQRLHIGAHSAMSADSISKITKNAWIYMDLLVLDIITNW